MFVDRHDAGNHLADRLIRAHQWPDVVVLGLPRGGVPVAAEISRVLHAPLDVIVVHKLGVPAQPELAFGAVGEERIRVLNRDVIERAGITPDQVEALSVDGWRAVDRDARAYRAVRSRASVVNCTALVVDDGVATGATARAACQVATEHGARRVVLAVPVAPVGWTRALAGVADECVALATPSNFGAVGAYYEDFGATSPAEVRDLLTRRHHNPDRTTQSRSTK